MIMFNGLSMFILFSPAETSYLTVAYVRIHGWDMYILFYSRLTVIGFVRERSTLAYSLTI